MKNYFKVYLRQKSQGWERIDIRTPSKVEELLEWAKKDGYERYLVVKTIEQQTDIILMHGFFWKECNVIKVDRLKQDWRVVGKNVVLWDKYKEREEERC